MLIPYAHPRKRIPRRSSASQAHQAYAFPSPQKGLDISQPLPGGDPMTAIVLENLIPRVLGCELRAGYRRWVSNLAGEVRTLMQYVAPSGMQKLFAATSTGAIYDVTVAQNSGVTPAPVVTVAGGQPDGEWTSFNYVTTAGVHVMLLVNPGNGYWVYDGTNFTQITQGVGSGLIEGVNPDDFVHVTVYQNRLWFVEGKSTRAWYLPVGEYAGKATEFDFGAMFPNGGALEVLINWTYDGTSGVGVNNQIVAVSDQGDVVVYGGDDPDEATTFRATGRWFIGRVPVGRRWFSIFGGDIILLSERGMNFMSEVMRGEGFFGNAAVAQSVNSAIATEVSHTLDTRYWEVSYLPVDQIVLINRAEFNAENAQWVYEVNNKAFATLRGIPMNTVNLYAGKCYTGDRSGNVWWALEGDSDGVVDGVRGADLTGTCVTAFQPMGEGFRVKRFLMVRPSFVAPIAPAVKAQLNREWSVAAPEGSAAYLGVGGNVWDVGEWDVAVWSGEAQAYEAWIGASGFGRYAALSLKIKGAEGTVFAGWQAIVEAGGVL